MISFTRPVLVAALTVAAFAAPAALAGQAPEQAVAPLPDGKVAVVNTDVFPEKIAELKEKYDQIESQYKSRFDVIQKLAEEAKAIGDKLSSSTDLTLDATRQLQTQYEDLQRRGTREETDLHDEVTRALDTATRPIQEKLKNFMSAYAREHGIVAVFNLVPAADSGLFAFWNPGTDITDDFVAAYNKANPAAGARTGTAPKPGDSPSGRP
ncbi:MAG TPA: OmpH family outer membrane protein [Terriglobia bacterium]|nr:OmpH family outer membrane protein [Terriglobia bacterium]